MANTYAIRSTPSETFNKLTVSCWFKGMADGTQRNFWGLYDNSDSNRFFGLYYSSNGSLYAYWKQDGSLQFTLGTMQKFRDPNAWYHFVMTMDTTLATASDRVKFYLNGERITVFEDPLETITQSKNVDLMNGTTDGRMQWGGGKISGTQYYWNGLMSHCHMCVGYSYDASSFGSVDNVTGEWQINTSPNVQYGTNGGFWFKDGNQLTDSSTNSNTLTVGGGTLTKTEDCPSNVFATFNPLSPSGSTYSNGNNDCSTVSGVYASRPTTSTLGVSSGKYYTEIKLLAPNTGTPDYSKIGITGRPLEAVTGSEQYQHLGSKTYDYAYNSYNGNIMNNTGNSNNGTAYGNTYTTNDIIGIALDLDNNKLYFSKNGTWQNSGDPTSGATGTGAVSIVDPASTSLGFYFFGVDAYHYTPQYNFSANFGNGYFGTTAVSSAGTNASGIGIFEYDVPTGFTALSTKGLNL